MVSNPKRNEAFDTLVEFARERGILETDLEKEAEKDENVEGDKEVGQSSR